MVINTIINEKNGACRFYSQTFMHGINFLGKLFTNKKREGNNSSWTAAAQR